MKKLLLGFCCLWASGVWAQMTPVGTEKDGILTGVIGKALQNDPKAKTICDLCKDDRKNQNIIGMEFVRNLKREGNKNLWAGGGKILDPNNGKEYTLEMVPIEDGKKLQVRGYIGPFYRTQVWLRVQ